MRRSVSTELDLEAGKYTVLLKITAIRLQRPTVDEVIRDNVHTRREKLLSIGLSYDLAHAKGRFRELEKEKKKHEKIQQKRDEKAALKKAHETRRKEMKKLKQKEEKKQAKIAEKKQRKKMPGETVMTPPESIIQLEKRSEDLRITDQLTDSPGLGISNIAEEPYFERAGRDPSPRPHAGSVTHQKSASTGTPRFQLNERSDSPSSGFGGRSGYNKGRDGYNANMGRDVSASQHSNLE
jgi:cell division protein FtsB